MALSPSIELTAPEAAQLLAIARQAVETAAREGRELEPPPLPGNLGIPAATFVTLTQAGALRGCMGSLEPSQPMAMSVARNAFNAALQDPRFAPMTPAETARTHIEVAVLSPLESMAVADLDELLRTLEPGIDGLLIDDGTHRATFLPKVWEQLPSPDAFVAHLLAKAGLEQDAWPRCMRCYRYGAAGYAEPLHAGRTQAS
ncbi:MAG: AmmeMemoRadiSam system protein A [Gammaproteobacteria bacterium]|nr:AmmeMemoRadiSam system protein A [Gammaproteobacteria bacterium]NNM00760.1 AmmeMemoRadiSam system protein A [Gammaproteobacteria bacterium]